VYCQCYKGTKKPPYNDIVFTRLGIMRHFELSDVVTMFDGVAVCAKCHKSLHSGTFAKLQRLDGATVPVTHLRLKL